MQDINQNKVSDFQDSLKDIRETEKYRAQMSMKREQESNKQVNQQQTMALKREEIQSKERIANTQLEIARENKNKYDVPQAKKSNKKEK
jgi:hypothetical protein